MSACIRFAEFELDLVAYSLRHPGGTVKLEKMPMEVLILLVQRAGALVLREEIKAKLWAPDVYGEHDSAINTVIRKIRHALGDDAESPRFVETVVGKGYRFIAPIESHLTEASAGSTADRRAALPAAYDAYLRGRHALDKRGEADVREAIRFFQQSIDADPTYAPAYAGLADSYGQLGYGSYISLRTRFPARARQQSERWSSIPPWRRGMRHSVTS